jgi:hypothetical protein
MTRVRGLLVQEQVLVLPQRGAWAITVVCLYLRGLQEQFVQEQRLEQFVQEELYLRGQEQLR